MVGRGSQGLGAGVVVAYPVGVPDDVQDHRPTEKMVQEGGCDGRVAQHSPQEVIGRFVVTIVEVLVYRWAITWNRAEAPSAGKAR
jgi:hypothetical protein